MPHLKLSEIKPEKTRELAALLANQDLWNNLEDLLMAVRQEYLEALLLAENTSDDILEARAVVAFIDYFTENLRENILAERESDKKEATGETRPYLPNEFMDISKDPNDPDPDSGPEPELTQ